MCDSALCDVWHCVCCISCDQCWVILITLGCHAAQPANLFVELHNFDIDVIDVNQCNVAQYLTIFALIIDFCSSCQLLTLRTCGQASQFYIHSHCVWMNRFISVKAPIPEENKEKREGTNRVFFPNIVKQHLTSISKLWNTRFLSSLIVTFCGWMCRVEIKR